MAVLLGGQILCPIQQWLVAEDYQHDNGADEESLLPTLVFYEIGEDQ